MAAHSIADVVARSLSPVSAQGYANMLFDAPVSSSPRTMTPFDAHFDDERVAPRPARPARAPDAAPSHAVPVRVDPLVAPQARRGALWLHPAPSRRRRGAARAPPTLAQARHAVQTVLYLAVRPRELAATARRSAAASAAYWDDAFRDPVSGQRLWWPPWLHAYTPLLVWIGVSVLSTCLVMAFHTRLFHALNALSLGLRRLGVAGRVLFGLLVFATTFPPMPLYSTMIVLSGYAFGRWQGFIVSYVAALSGAAVVFVLSRTWLRGWMVRLLTHTGSLKRVVRAIERRPRLLFLVRLAPYPYNLLNTLLASSHVLTFSTYMGCTALALPKLLVHTSVGASLESFAGYQTERAPSGAGSTGGAPAHGGSQASTLHRVASSVGVLLCVGIFVYLCYMTRCAVDELDDSSVGDMYSDDSLTDLDAPLKTHAADVCDSDGDAPAAELDHVHIPLLTQLRDTATPLARRMTPSAAAPGAPTSIDVLERAAEERGGPH